MDLGVWYEPVIDRDVFRFAYGVLLIHRAFCPEHVAHHVNIMRHAPLDRQTVVRIVGDGDSRHGMAIGHRSQVAEDAVSD